MKVRITDLLDDYCDDSIRLTELEDLPHRTDGKPVQNIPARKTSRTLKRGVLIAASLLLVLTAAVGIKLGLSRGTDTPQALAEGSAAEQTEPPQVSDPQTTGMPAEGSDVEETGTPIITTDQNFYSQTIDTLPITDPNTGLEGTVTSIMVTANYAVFDFQLDEYGNGNAAIDSAWENLIDNILQNYLIVETTDGTRQHLEATGMQNPIESTPVAGVNYERVCFVNVAPEEIAFISLSDDYFFNNLPYASDGNGTKTVPMDLGLITGFTVNPAAGTYTWTIAAENVASLEENSQDYVRAVNSLLEDFHDLYDGQIYLLFENGDRLALKSGVIRAETDGTLSGTGTICEDAALTTRDLSTITGVEICGETYLFDEGGEADADEPEQTSGDTDGDGILTADYGVGFVDPLDEANNGAILRFEIDPEAGTFAWYIYMENFDAYLNNETYRIELENYLLGQYFANAYLVATDGTRIQLGSGDMISCDPENLEIREESPLAAAGVEGWEGLTWDHLEVNGESYAFH